MPADDPCWHLSLLPVEWRCQADQSVSPMCDEETCSQWLMPELPSARQLEEHAHQWAVRSFQWHRSRFPRLMWNQTLRFIPRAPSESFYRRHPLVEVTRHSKLFSGWYDWCAQGSSIRADEWVGNVGLAESNLGAINDLSKQLQRARACTSACWNIGPAILALM